MVGFDITFGGVASHPHPNYIPADELKPTDEAHTLIVVEDGVKKRKRSDRCSRLARTAKIVDWGEDQTQILT